MPQTNPAVLVLAGGASRRFWPLGDKNQLVIAGQSVLGRHLRSLIEVGLDEVVVVARADNAEPLRAIASPYGARVVIQEGTGMGDAVLSGLEVTSLDRSVYVTSSHVLPSADLHRTVAGADDGAGAIAARSIVPGQIFTGGWLRFGPDGRLAGIIEKPAPGHIPPERLAAMVAHLHPDPDRLRAELRAACAQGGDDAYERAVTRLCETLEYRAHRYDGPWVSLKHPWQVLDAMAAFLATLPVQVSPEAQIAPSALIEGPVHIEAGAVIGHAAQVSGPAWIGPGAYIGSFACVRSSVVEAGAVIGTGSEVVRSHVGAGAKAHGARILDSVVGASLPGQRATDLAAGMVTANLRADGAEVRSMSGDSLVGTGRRKLGAMIGAGAFVCVHAALMPGVKIGPGVTVGPAAVVYRDISEEV